MRTIIFRFTVILLLGACHDPAATSDPDESAEPRGTPEPASLESTERHFLPSSFSDQNYRIDVALPTGYWESEQTYPALYLLDADVLLGLATDLTRLLPIEEALLGELRVPKMAVVGIAYPGGVEEMTERRGWDFSPPNEVNPHGAAHFYRFLAEDLVPFVEARYRFDPAERTLVGASRAGAFVLSTLFQHSETFQRYIAISPVVLAEHYEYQRTFSERGLGSEVRLFLASGSAGPVETEIAAGVEELAAVLDERQNPALSWSRGSFAGESHISVMPRALIEGLVAVFDQPSNQR